MTDKNTLRVRMVEFANSNNPCIEVTYTNRDGEKRQGLMTIDSCSRANHLMGKFAKDVLTAPAKGLDKISIQSMGDTEKEAPCVSAKISFGGEDFEEDFVVQEDFGIDIEGDRPFLGLLGCGFMLRHHLVVDFSNHTVYRSFVNPSNFCIADTDYFFPMEIGLKLYSVPVVGLKTDDGSIVAAIDSGTNESVITASVIPEVSTSYQFTGNHTNTECFTCKVDSEEVVAEFILLGVNDDGEITKLHKNADRFLAVESHIFSKEQPEDTPEEQRIPEVKALIGANFMKTNGWTLDFGVGLIYKRRVPLSA